MSLITKAKKQIWVLATSLSMIEASMKFEDQQLECILFIQYPLKFNKSYTKVQVLIDSNNKINIITSIYAAILELRICSTNIGAQKIDKFTLSTYGMTLANFQLKDKQKKTHFF